MLAYGNGRSYGDSCINEGGTLLLTRGLDRYRTFDAESGLLECESGALLSDIVRDFLPRGWFLPVTPGTRFVTLGGAIANDVHGKNHHVAGSFGNHVESLVLERSDGAVLRCSPQENAGLFRATVGGLGLTGLIRSATLRLRKVETGWMSVHHQRFESIQDFLSIDEWAEARFEYTVSWIDCASGGRSLRGIYLAGNHTTSAEIRPRPPFPSAAPGRNIPITPPVSLVRPLSVKAMNAVYWRRTGREGLSFEPLVSYFYPLDGLSNWNRVYGPAGFYQYQCVLVDDAEGALAEMLDIIKASGQGSFLAVLKRFGAHVPVGLLSFPRAGVTVALDFPNRGEQSHALFERLDRVVLEASGALYPAKDARMPASMFAASYPLLNEFSDWKDPRFSSTFWRRVTGTP